MFADIFVVTSQLVSVQLFQFSQKTNLSTTMAGLNINLQKWLFVLTATVPEWERLKNKQQQQQQQQQKLA